MNYAIFLLTLFLVARGGEASSDSFGKIVEDVAPEQDDSPKDDRIPQPTNPPARQMRDAGNVDTLHGGPENKAMVLETKGNRWNVRTYVSEP